MTPLERLAARHPDWIVYEPLVAALLDVVRAGDEAEMAYCYSPPLEMKNEAGDVEEVPCGECAGCSLVEARAKLDALIQERFPETEPVPPS